MSENRWNFPETPEILKHRFNWRMLQYFGAGAILASVTIGSGETLMSSRGGSVFGYSILWCVLLACVAKGFQVYTAARYMTLTGQHPLEHWARFPGPPKWIPAFLGLLSLWCFPFLLAFLTLVMGEIITQMFHIAGPNDPEFRMWTRIWATVGAMTAIALTLLQSYKVIERVQTVVIGLLLVSIGAACLASSPEWLNVLNSLLVPSVPAYEPWLMEKYADQFQDRTPWVEVTAIVGFIGGGTYDYLGYIGCLREKAWGAIPLSDSARGVDSTSQNSDETEPGENEGNPLDIPTDVDNLRRGLMWLRPAAIDVSVSFLCVFLFSVCFVILGASVLHPQHIVPAKDGELLTHQAQFLTRFHPSLLYLYQVGVFMAFWGTIYGAYEIYSRTLYECLRPLSARLRKIDPVRVRHWVLAYCGIFGVLLVWLTEQPIKLITFPSLVGGVLTCGLWCFGMIWLERKNLPAPLRMGPLLLVATILSGVAMTAMGGHALIQYVISIFS